MDEWPDKSPEPAAVDTVSSAFAFPISSRGGSAFCIGRHYVL